MDTIDQIQVLVVDNDEDDFIVTRDLLSRVEGVSFSVQWAATFDSALTESRRKAHDVILVAYLLGAKSGLDFLQTVIAAGCQIPIILFTDQADHEVDLAAMKAGAADYLVRADLSAVLLGRSIRYAIERKRAENRILTLAYYDDLTGLPNRVLFLDRLNFCIANARRREALVAVLICDLDNFKRINDTLGHEAGDLLVREVGERISACVRENDAVGRLDEGHNKNTVARQGGDEFTLLLGEIRNIHDAARVAQRILGSLARPFDLRGHEVFVSASIGIAIFPQDGVDADTLVKNGDAAMYHAKDRGKNNYQFYKKEMNATSFQRLSLETSLRRALEREEFLLYYQPVVNLYTGKLVSAEALVRWQHPDMGLISPADFIPLAEETGMIVPLGEWVLLAACAQNKAWQQAGLPLVRVAVNLSCQQFAERNLARVVEEVLEETGLAADYLGLEITESLMMRNVDASIAVLRELSSMGVSLSLDDFGTGYSSLSYLKRFPLDILKIDRSFVREIPHDNDDVTLTRVILAMAGNLGLKVVAEGVENQEQLEFLKNQGCDMMQGYLVSPPVSVADFRDILVREASGKGIGRLICGTCTEE